MIFTRPFSFSDFLWQSSIAEHFLTAADCPRPCGSSKSRQLSEEQRNLINHYMVWQVHVKEDIMHMFRTAQRQLSYNSNSTGRMVELFFSEWFLLTSQISLGILKPVRRSGGIGRRAGFRCLLWFTQCGFKSHLLHPFFVKDQITENAEVSELADEQD